MIEFIGRFHPLFVHLPIGILLVALLFFAMTRRAKYQSLTVAIPVLLLAGSISALFSCITGYLLSVNDDYDEALVSKHMWMGIAVTALSIFFYLQYTNSKIVFSKKITAIILLVAIAITGHLGGSLTHGSDYISAPLASMFSSNGSGNYKILPLKNAQQAMVYTDVVKPILQTKCYSCHNAGKQKSSLRMDDSLLLMKGGKHGIIIDLKDADASELLQRLHLPLDNEHHMPPKEKPQLTESQVQLLHWWIRNGASFSKKVKELPQDGKIKTILTALQQVPNDHEANPALTLKPVAAANPTAINYLKATGIVVQNAMQHSNYLLVSFVSNKNISNDDLSALLQLKQQVIQLKMNSTNLDNRMADSIAQLTSLIKLDVSYTSITDEGLSAFKNLQQLQSINLVGNNITFKGLQSLAAIKTIKNIYIYKTKVDAVSFARLTKMFPRVTIDTGGYQVPTLATDTSRLKADY